MFLRGMVPRRDECDNVLRAFKGYLTILPLLTALAFYASASTALASTVGTEPTQARPTVVRVGLVIRNVIAIDEVRENWQVSGLLVAKWTDRALRYRPRGRRQLNRNLPANTWKPDFEFTNEETPTTFHFVDLFTEPDGTVTYTQRFTATLSTSSDLRRFPFDSQLLPLVVQASGDDLDRTILKPDRQGSALSNRGYAGLAHWQALSLTERLGTVAGTANRANDVEFALKVRRNSKSYILKFIVPLLLLVIISWVTFWLSHEEFKTKDQLQSAVVHTSDRRRFQYHRHEPLTTDRIYHLYRRALIHMFHFCHHLHRHDRRNPSTTDQPLRATRVVRAPARRRRSPGCVCDRSSDLVLYIPCRRLTSLCWKAPAGLSGSSGRRLLLQRR